MTNISIGLWVTKMTDFDVIRRKTRLALPESNDYLFRLGVALYGFASINSFVTEIICHVDNTQNRTKLLDKTSGEVITVFKKTIDITRIKYPDVVTIMEETLDLFSILNNQRTDFVHAYPITSSKDGKTQILHRRQDTKNKYFEIDNEFLDNFISNLDKLSDNLYKIRKQIKEYKIAQKNQKILK